MNSSTSSKKLIESLLMNADIRINGDRAWDINVHNERFYDRVLSQGSLGLGESYMDGWWDCAALDEFFFRVLRSKIYERIPMNFSTLFAVITSHLFNLQTIKGSRAVAEKHYNLNNNFYKAMLDPYMQYSCGYFKNTENLKTAQEQKLDLICRKLQLKESDHLLDIGCGWGGLAKFAAEKYGCTVTGINISTEQIAFAQTFCKGLPVEIIEADYRTFTGTFDKIVSVGMFEHVGSKNYSTYMETARRCIKDDGLFLLHSIGNNKKVKTLDPWIAKYIFPHSELPAPGNVSAAFEHHFVMEDWHNFGAFYDKTLMAWHANFADHWETFHDHFGDTFERMWRYYLLSCAGAFRSRDMELWQIVLSPRGTIGGYDSVR